MLYSKYLNNFIEEQEKAILGKSNIYHELSWFNFLWTFKIFKPVFIFLTNTKSDDNERTFFY